MYEEGLDQTSRKNYDECHFIIDLDDRRCLDFSGKKQVTYLVKYRQVVTVSPFAAE